MFKVLIVIFCITNTLSKEIEVDEKWNEYKECEICGGRYSRNTRTTHFRTKKHKLIGEIKKLEKKLHSNKKKKNKNK